MSFHLYHYDAIYDSCQNWGEYYHGVLAKALECGDEEAYLRGAHVALRDGWLGPDEVQAELFQVFRRVYPDVSD
ncbi:hypothetical protein [Nisaea denitrificans]|uniref:hypothetical protein n=1 Tax=Nisaea denitrificans TaxID=390877 RepID=UPI00042690CF|nr:hypothetical protein [Nisaea denitrificans]